MIPNAANGAEFVAPPKFTVVPFTTKDRFVEKNPRPRRKNGTSRSPNAKKTIWIMIATRVRVLALDLSVSSPVTFGVKGWEGLGAAAGVRLKPQLGQKSAFCCISLPHFGQ